MRRLLRRIANRILPAPVLNDYRHIGPFKHSTISTEIAKKINIIRSYYYPKKVICFLPQDPLPGSHRGAIAYKLCRLLGYKIATETSERYDVVFKYTRETFSNPLSSDQFNTSHVINGGSTDISKRTVSATFEEVFGYPIGVDPTTYAGKIVVKSNLNSVHDGHLTEGPIAPSDVQEENAYQRAIDNTVPDKGAVLDYRVPIHGDEIPLVYLKYRPLDSRFSNRSAHAVIKQPDDVFSEDELDKIHQFVQRMGIDYGELDVLRDNDGRIYVVDANPAPWGPPIGLEAADRMQALLRLEKSFDRLLRRHST